MSESRQAPEQAVQPAPPVTATPAVPNRAVAERPPGIPRWLAVPGLAVIVVIVAFAVLHLTGHAPMAHMPSAAALVATV
jgi:hypothetical protein